MKKMIPGTYSVIKENCLNLKYSENNINTPDIDNFSK